MVSQALAARLLLSWIVRTGAAISVQLPIFRPLAQREQHNDWLGPNRINLVMAALIADPGRVTLYRVKGIIWRQRIEYGLRELTH